MHKPDLNVNNINTMAQDTRILQFIINVLTKAQYDALPSVNPDQFYYITDDETFAKIDDSLVSMIKTWSSSKINTMIKYSVSNAIDDIMPLIYAGL